MRPDAINSRTGASGIGGTVFTIAFFALSCLLEACSTETRVQTEQPKATPDKVEPVSPIAPDELTPTPHIFVEKRELAAVADTFVQRSHPDRNEGWATELKVGSPDPFRTLIAFEPDAIRIAAKNRDLVSATLQFVIDETDHEMWSWGRVLNLYRMTQVWSELGATWDCAEDTNPANAESDCPEDRRWGMSGRDRPRSWVAEPVSSVIVGMGQTGVLSFDVTEDIKGFLAGEYNHFGWILQKRGDLRQLVGGISFASGEIGNPPVLALTVSCPDTDDDRVCNVEDNCPDGVNTDQADLDRDGTGNFCDWDDDNDLVDDLVDPEPLNAGICGDSDGDTCDDCVVERLLAPANDGTDTDLDGVCDAGDRAPRNPRICGDLDRDTCDDCVVAGQQEPLNDGRDTDRDGLCDAGDPDDDNDMVVDWFDPEPLNPGICGDSDGDTCDDCAVANRQAPLNDGTDTDSDGICDQFTDTEKRIRP